MRKRFESKSFKYLFIFETSLTKNINGKNHNKLDPFSAIFK